MGVLEAAELRYDIACNYPKISKAGAFTLMARPGEALVAGLYGIWSADCFLYTLSLSFSTSLIDDEQAIGEFLREQFARNKEKTE